LTAGIPIQDAPLEVDHSKRNLFTKAKKNRLAWQEVSDRIPNFKLQRNFSTGWTTKVVLV
jgi:hypothetical protein